MQTRPRAGLSAPAPAVTHTWSLAKEELCAGSTRSTQNFFFLFSAFSGLVWIYVPHVKCHLLRLLWTTSPQMTQNIIINYESLALSLVSFSASPYNLNHPTFLKFMLYHMPFSSVQLVQLAPSLLVSPCFS